MDLYQFPIVSIGIREPHHGMTKIYVPTFDAGVLKILKHKDGIKTVIWLPDQQWITVWSSGPQTILQRYAPMVQCTGHAIVKSSCSTIFRVSTGGKVIVRIYGTYFDSELRIPSCLHSHDRSRICIDSENL